MTEYEVTMKNGKAYVYADQFEFISETTVLFYRDGDNKPVETFKDVIKVDLNRDDEL